MIMNISPAIAYLQVLSANGSSREKIINFIRGNGCGGIKKSKTATSKELEIAKGVLAKAFIINTSEPLFDEYSQQEKNYNDLFIKNTWKEFNQIDENKLTILKNQYYQNIKNHFDIKGKNFVNNFVANYLKLNIYKNDIINDHEYFSLLKTKLPPEEFEFFFQTINKNNRTYKNFWNIYYEFISIEENKKIELKKTLMDSELDLIFKLNSLKKAIFYLNNLKKIKEKINNFDINDFKENIIYEIDNMEEEDLEKASKEIAKINDSDYNEIVKIYMDSYKKEWNYKSKIGLPILLILSKFNKYKQENNTQHQQNSSKKSIEKLRKDIEDNSIIEFEIKKAKIIWQNCSVYDQSAHNLLRKENNYKFHYIIDNHFDEYFRFLSFEEKKDFLENETFWATFQYLSSKGLDKHFAQNACHFFNITKEEEKKIFDKIFEIGKDKEKNIIQRAFFHTLNLLSSFDGDARDKRINLLKQILNIDTDTKIKIKKISFFDEKTKKNHDFSVLDDINKIFFKQLDEIIKLYPDSESVMMVGNSDFSLKAFESINEWFDSIKSHQNNSNTLEKYLEEKKYIQAFKIYTKLKNDKQVISFNREKSINSWSLAEKIYSIIINKLNGTDRDNTLYLLVKMIEESKHCDVGTKERLLRVLQGLEIDGKIYNLDYFENPIDYMSSIIQDNSNEFFKNNIELSIDKNIILSEMMDKINMAESPYSNEQEKKELTNLLIGESLKNLKININNNFKNFNDIQKKNVIISYYYSYLLSKQEEFSKTFFDFP